MNHAQERCYIVNTGEKIKAARKKAGITQEELGIGIGVTKAAISRYESNQREPDFLTLHKIADALNCSLNDLLDQPPIIPQWRKVEEDPPKEAGEYIVMIKGGASATALLYNCREWFEEVEIETCAQFSRTARTTYRVTHWMPLPEPPEEE